MGSGRQDFITHICSLGHGLGLRVGLCQGQTGICRSFIAVSGAFPKASCAQIVFTLAPKYPCRDDVKAKFKYYSGTWTLIFRVLKRIQGARLLRLGIYSSRVLIGTARLRDLVFKQAKVFGFL